uniref:MULE transposase domain-containing protein n=1 Tax=Lactuca sativa TaxID=4236 RepID=A0A9R1UZG5_LACSA|nr:hypothetical protein LSAT_V11C700368590 [Lactuca sativa]
MALNYPFMIILYWEGNIEYENGFNNSDQATFSASDILRHKIWYKQFKDLIYTHDRVEKPVYKLNLSLCYQYCGRSNMVPLINDSSLDMMYYLTENDENYCGQIYVDTKGLLAQRYRVLPSLLEVEGSSLIGDISDEGESSSSMHHASPCQWYIHAIKKKSHNIWQITRQVDAYNCFGSCIGNDKGNLNSKIIASYIIHSIEKDVAYLVDVSYNKAWHGRRKSIEKIYGTWESNSSLNPDTIVTWFHKPNGTSHVATFKYIFWAFIPSITTFHFCRPIIYVNGTHLKDLYKGKMLVVVAKDANNHILPIFYVILDEEIVHSWSWFFYQFRQFVATNRQICVILDMNQGIIHALANL